MKPLYYTNPRNETYKCYWEKDVWDVAAERSDYCNYECSQCRRRKIATLNKVDPVIDEDIGFFPEYDFKCPDCAPERYGDHIAN